MHWMSLTELNIFTIVILIVFTIMLSITVTAFGNRLDEHRARIIELEKEVERLKNEKL